MTQTSKVLLPGLGLGDGGLRSWVSSSSGLGGLPLILLLSSSLILWSSFSFRTGATGEDGASILISLSSSSEDEDDDEEDDVEDDEDDEDEELWSFLLLDSLSCVAKTLASTSSSSSSELISYSEESELAEEESELALE